MPGSLQSFTSRRSQGSRRSLPYNLRSRTSPAPASNQIPEEEADNSSSTSSSGIIFEDFPLDDDHNEQAPVEDEPPSFDSVVSESQPQNSDPLSDGIPYRHGEPIPEGYSRHAAMLARIRQTNLE
jgi:hypothetical protein